MSEWKEHKLAEFIEVRHGHAFKGNSITDEPTENILVTPGNFHIGGGFKSSKLKYFNSSFPKEYILNEGDIVVTMTDLSKESDTLGYSAKIPKSNGVKYLHNQRIGLVQFKSKEVCPDFVYWLMRTREYQAHIVGSASGTSIMHTSPSRIKDYKFFLPPLPEQKSIASILSSLDDKIDLLHRQNATLEAMAETLFRQWFVEEAKEEWESYRVSDIADHFKINVKPSSSPTSTCFHYSIPAFDAGQMPAIELGKDILSNKYQVLPNSILVSKLNPRFPRIWGIEQPLEENSICSTEFQVFKPKDEKMYGYLLYLFKSDLAKDELEMAASGTSGSHQRVRPEDILNIGFNIPSFEMAIQFSETVQPLTKKISKNKVQSKTLVALRDILLPKLMTGEVNVTAYGKEFISGN